MSGRSAGLPEGFIPLDRQFIALEDQEPAQVESRFLTARSAGSSLGWPDLLEKRRVVLLAEAGSGKSEELKAVTAQLVAHGKFAFYARLQDIGHEGFPAALPIADQKVFEAWKASDQSAWIFADSVDEARLDNVSLEKALRRISDGIDGASTRAHVYLSSRYTDWEFKADLTRFGSFLPLPDVKPPEQSEPPEKLLTRILRNEQRAQKPSPKTERPLVALMTPLDAERVRRFAAANGVAQLDAFLAAIGDGNLWSLAARPVDLIWLVDYWQKHKRFGRLEEMLNASLGERLKETNPEHSRQDPISAPIAKAALERIGAALDFGRTDRLQVPDSQFALPTGASPFSLGTILPDWPTKHLQHLLTRPAFDPATFGTARLHNDNQGVVRSYLAARWLHARRLAGCPYKTIASLLFADSYGLKVVRPSMTQTVAWLSIWDEDVAREVLARDPLLLISGGDPASLTPATRSEVVERVVERMVADEDRFHRLDYESIKRLAASDTVGAIRTLWPKHKGNAEACRLLLMMVELGKLSGCVDIAEEAALGSFFDRYTSIYAGRALLATADPALRARYAEHVKQHFAKLAPQALWDALEELVPTFIDLTELLDLLARMTPEQRDDNYGLQIHGPRLVANLQTKEELQQLLETFLPAMGQASPSYNETDDEKAFEPSIAAAAARLLEMTPVSEAPEIVIDAAVRLGSDRLYRTSGKNAELQTALHASAERRRLSFWRAAALLRTNPILSERAITTVIQLDMLGWPPGLRREDLDWLLPDIAGRAEEDDKALATNAALFVWRNSGQQPEVLERIKAAAEPISRLGDHIAAWLAPASTSPELERTMREHEKIRRKHEKERAARDKNWLEFLEKLKADPAQLDDLPQPTADNVDGRLYYLWHLFNAAAGENGRYAIDDTSAVELVLGPELTAAMVRAFKKFWRQWRPVLECERAPDKRNQISLVDCIGIAGVTLDAKDDPDWARKLTREQATRAAQYATLELNGFPPWLETLADCWPEEVLAVILGEVRAQLETNSAASMPGMLHDLVYGPSRLAVLVACGLLTELEGRSSIAVQLLSQALDVMARALASGAQLPGFSKFALARFATATDDEAQAHYLGAAFGEASEAAAEALRVKLSELPAPKQTQLAKRVLPRIFGNHAFGRRGEVPELPFAVLETLVVVAYRTIRPDEDNRHTSGQAYTPDERDAAEASRSSAFNQLANTPGPMAFAALRRLEAMSDFPVPKSNIRRLIEARAQQDSERSGWGPGEAYQFERTFDLAPTTPADLQLVALGSIDDIQHSLLHSDFAQGLTVKRLPNEMEVQKWLAHELRQGAGRAYTVDREPHVVDEKKPDIRLRATASAASLPIEVKVPDRLTLANLEAALLVQLSGRYLRAEDARHGVLLLVHQRKRAVGWRGPTGATLAFDQVVQHLASIAEAEASKAHDSPRAKIAVIDVSSLFQESGPERSGGRKR